MGSPKVSVVIPTFNRRDKVVSAIESVLAQSYDNIEVIVVDDGSTDGTVPLVEARFKGDERIRLIRHEANRGGAAARNTGIDASSGDFVAFLDSDDAWDRHKLEKQVGVLLSGSGGDCGAVCCGRRIIDDEGRIVAEVYPSWRGALADNLVHGNCIGSCSTVLVRRDILNAVGGFDERLKSCQDWDLWWRLAQVTRFACLNEVLVEYSDTRTERISTNWRSRLSGRLRVYRKHLRPHLRQNRIARAQFCDSLARIFLQANRYDWARRLSRMCIAANPAKLDVAMYYVLTTFDARMTPQLRAGYRMANNLRRRLRQMMRGPSGHRY